MLFDTKTPPSILRWEILNRVLALSVKGDWPAVDQHLISLGRNNMEISSTEIEVIMNTFYKCNEYQHAISRKSQIHAQSHPRVETEKADMLFQISRNFFLLS